MGYGEWEGNWSDESDLWTKRMENILKYTPCEFLDGIFWMEFEDFFEEFDVVYLCRNFEEKDGWYTDEAQGKWEGKYAEGLPTPSFRSAQLGKNPQYTVTAHKPGIA